MGKDSIKKLGKLKTSQERLEIRSFRDSQSVKIGDTVEYYVYADNNEVLLKSSGVGVSLNKSKSVIQPGSGMSFSIPYQLVDFNKMSFHPAADQPSTSVFPHATFIPTILDEDIKITRGMYSTLKSNFSPKTNRGAST